MKINFLLLLLGMALFSCQKEANYSPTLSPAQQDSLKYKIIRYVAKPPKKATPETKFEAQFDDYYQEQAFQKHQLDLHFKTPDGTEFLLVSRIAPSIEEKRVATGIKLKFDEKGKLLQYEEVFRTWKMRPELLKERATLLFVKMTEGQDLSPYYPQNNEEEYIEFPDAKTYYDAELRLWKVRAL